MVELRRNNTRRPLPIPHNSIQKIGTYHPLRKRGRVGKRLPRPTLNDFPSDTINRKRTKKPGFPCGKPGLFSAFTDRVHQG
jgi:hypothetical protein